LADGYDFEIDVDITNATPAAMDQAKQSYITFLSLCRNFPETTMSPTLIRENAYRSGYRNERVIHQMQQVALLAMAAKTAQLVAIKGQTMGQVSGASNGATGDGSNVAETQVAQQATPPDAAIDQQITNQLM